VLKNSDVGICGRFDTSTWGGPNPRTVEICSSVPSWRSRYPSTP